MLTAIPSHLQHLDLGLAPRVGVDEAGRGPLAGPVVAAAVILNEDIPQNLLLALNDSKKLTERKRSLLALELEKNAIISCAFVAPAVIDQINIRMANFKAMNTAIEAIATPDATIFVDGREMIPRYPNCHPIIKGDGKIYAIAAASIIAKTYRDRLMQQAALVYPEYGFERHKGYPTKQHIHALQKYGPCPIHRLSYAPVAKVC